MKNQILPILLILALCLTSCTPTTKPNQTISDIPSSSPSETISESSSGMVSSEDSVELTPNEVAIKTLLNNLKMNQIELIEVGSLKSYNYDEIELAFQNVYGDEVPELLVRIKGNSKNVRNEIIIFSIVDGKVEKNQQLDFLALPTKDERQVIVKMGSDYFVKLEHSYSCDAIFFGAHGGGYENMTPDVYIDYYSADVREIYFAGVTKYPESDLLFRATKTPFATAFFNYLLVKEDVEEFSLSRCHPNFNKETGLYEKYTVGKVGIEAVYSKGDYSGSIKEQLDKGHDIIEVTKAEYEYIYAKYFAQFEEVENPIYRSGFYNKVAIDYDKILEEAIAFFE